MDLEDECVGALLRTCWPRRWRLVRDPRMGPGLPVCAAIVCRGAGRYLGRVSVLNPTPRDRLLDPQGRPYFLWEST